MVQALGDPEGHPFSDSTCRTGQLVRCTRGRVLDVAVDLRRSSQRFTRWVAVELSPQNRKQLYVPVGFGHAFLTVEDDAEVLYRVSQHYSREHDAAIRWDDPDIAIEWPIGEAEVILSQKDAAAQFLRGAPALFA